MALLINGISNLELTEIGEIIYGVDKFSIEKSSDKELVEIWLTFRKHTFMLSKMSFSKSVDT